MANTWTFKSSSGSGTYTTTLADDGKLLCDCKGWTVRRKDKPRHCKHTKKIADNAGVEVVERGEFVYLPAAGALHLKPGTDVAFQPAEPQTKEPESPAPGPMLASAMTEPVTGAAFDHAFASGWCMEEKLDGHRCIVLVLDGEAFGFSRPRAGGTGAKQRELPAHIVAVLKTFPNGVYDGELCVPGGKSWNVVELGASLVLMLFDILNIDGEDLTARPYDDRRDLLLRVLMRMPDSQTAVSTVESVPPTWAGVEAIWQRGGEGVILKRLDSTYRSDYRSPDWLKVKEVKAATLTVTGFEAGKNGPYSVLKLRDTSGHDTTVKTLTTAMLRDIEANPDAFIGRQVVVSYQMKTPSGSYRHIIFDHWAGEAERIVDTSPTFERIEPSDVAQALGAKPVTDRSEAARKAAATRRARRAVA